VSSQAGPTADVRLFDRYLKEMGLPVTSQREAVAHVVFESDGHQSVDEIEDALRARGEKIGKATIYRTLDLLVRSNLVDELDFGEGFKRYEHRLSSEPIHEHLICLNCSKVEEFIYWDVHKIEAMVSTDFGFRPHHHKLAIYGVCKACHDAGFIIPHEGLTCPIQVL